MMAHWKFMYEYKMGRGKKSEKRSGAVTLAASDLEQAMRAFRLWAAGQPSNREQITTTEIKKEGEES